jgi:hypothetical protein
MTQTAPDGANAAQAQPFTRLPLPPAMQAILSSPDNGVQGFLAAGH